MKKYLERQPHKVVGSRGGTCPQCPTARDASVRNPLKLAGVPQTTGPISAVSGPKFNILCGHLEEIGPYCCLTSFFPIVHMCLSCEDIAGQSCQWYADGDFFASFLRPAFPASRMQHISDLHSKFALGPHHVWKYGRHPICGR